MTEVLLMLFVFVALGLFSHRLGRSTYALMGLVIVAYMAYAFNK
jgi:lipopolysaccharide export LptBFGC system permease protein LptF